MSISRKFFLTRNRMDKNGKMWLDGNDWENPIQHKTKGSFYDEKIIGSIDDEHDGDSRKYGCIFR